MFDRIYPFAVIIRPANLCGKGDAARLFKWAATGDDPLRGRYLDNTVIGALCFEILGEENPNSSEE
jgi:hypothetical protein